MRFDQDRGKFILSNRSGRYGSYAQFVRQQLENAAAILRKTGLDVEVCYLKPRKNDDITQEEFLRLAKDPASFKSGFATALGEDRRNIDLPFSKLSSVQRTEIIDVFKEQASDDELPDFHRLYVDLSNAKTDIDSADSLSQQKELLSLLKNLAEGRKLPRLKKVQLNLSGLANGIDNNLLEQVCEATISLDGNCSKRQKIALDLSHCNLGNKELIALADALEKCSTVKSLNLIGNEIRPEIKQNFLERVTNANPEIEIKW